MKSENSTTYNLYSTERIFKDYTLLSYYFQPNRKIIKNYSPVDIGGERLRLNLQTGEVENYKKKTIVYNHDCSVRRTKILLKMLLEMNNFDWFCTLTFDKNKIDRHDDKAVYNCYKKYINNLSHKFPKLRYICVLERHGVKDDEEYGCIHFHLLIGGVKPSELGLVNSGKVCCSWATKKNGICSKEYFEKTKDLHELKETDGETIYNITSFAYGLTTASKIVSPERCKSYVAKYINKDVGYSTEAFKKRFYYSANLNVPAVVKKLVGADFEEPLQIDTVSAIAKSPLWQFAEHDPYISEYNTMQFKIDNILKKQLENGLLPIDTDLSKIFKPEQISIKE